MKLASMILILIVLQGTIMLYDGLYDTSIDEDLNPYGDNETTMWEFAMNPTSWNDSPFVILIAGIAVLGIGFIVAGIFLNTPSDTALFFPIFIGLIAIGMVPVGSLSIVFTREVAMFGCTGADMSCLPALLTWVFTGGVLAVFYILSVLEWWSGRSTG